MGVEKDSSLTSRKRGAANGHTHTNGKEKKAEKEAEKELKSEVTRFLLTVCDHTSTFPYNTYIPLSKQ